MSDTQKRGYLYATLAYGTWGFLPLFWKVLNPIPPLVILSYRILFSFGTALLVFLVIRPAFTRPTKKIAQRTLISSLVISLNWFVYVYAVVNGYTLEASLGYFLTPLVNAVLGIVLLKEKPGIPVLVSLGLGAIALFILALSYGRIPYFALILSMSFGLYGYLKKGLSINSLEGLAWETGWALPLALGILLYQGGFSYLADQTLARTTTVLLSGPVTLVPLVLFASAAKRLPLYLLGMFQYLAPSIMFLIGWLVFGEPVTSTQFFAFGLVWIALANFAWFKSVRVAARLPQGS